MTLHFRVEGSYILVPGQKGDEGSDGEPGENGPSGRPGKEGLPGKPGKKGTPGQPGQSGRCGPAGRPGEIGAVGNPGPVGSQGSTGSPGSGIETQEYYQKYKSILRAQMEGALDKVTIRVCFSFEACGRLLRLQSSKSKFFSSRCKMVKSMVLKMPSNFTTDLLS